VNFYDFYDKVNGPLYKDGTPPPVKYEFGNYLDLISNNPRMNGTEEDSTYELKPLDLDDMKRYAADDVVDAYAKIHNGKNPNRLGDPMTDSEFKKFTGRANHPL
jgi:hypothetical protein